MQVHIDINSGFEYLCWIFRHETIANKIVPE